MTDHSQENTSVSTRGSPVRRDERRIEDIYEAGADWRRGAVAVSDLLPALVDPIYARKGLSSSQLVSAWPMLAGSAFAECTMIETIKWPYQNTNGAPAYQGGTLVVRVDGPQAVYLQHEEQQIIQRVNRFLGFHAIARLKIIQAPITRIKKQKREPLPELSPAQERRLRDCVTAFDDPELNEAVLKMGREVLKRALSEK